MTPAALIALLPAIEALLADAPELISDIEAIIARVKGGPSAAPVDTTSNMQALDTKLEAFK